MILSRSFLGLLSYSNQLLKITFRSEHKTDSKEDGQLECKSKSKVLSNARKVIGAARLFSLICRKIMKTKSSVNDRFVICSK